MTAITDGVSDQADRFDGRVQCQELVAFAFECVNAGVIPDISPVTAMLTEFEIVDMRNIPLFENKHHFVVAAIETPHASVIFDPDANLAW